MKGDNQRVQYLTRRLELQPQEMWDLMDAWPLYVGKENLKRYMVIGSLLGRILQVPGDIAEFGVWRGATTSFIAKLLADFPKVIHAFDTFEGFNEDVTAEKELRSNYKGNMTLLERMLALDKLEDAVELHVGDINQTVPLLRQAQPEIRLSFAYLDCDVYDATATALSWVHERLSPGGMIVFDEFGDPAWPGESEAAEEFLVSHTDAYRQEATSVRQPSLVLVKL